MMNSGPVMGFVRTTSSEVPHADTLVDEFLSVQCAEKDVLLNVIYNFQSFSYTLVL